MNVPKFIVLSQNSYLQLNLKVHKKTVKNMTRYLTVIFRLDSQKSTGKNLKCEKREFEEEMCYENVAQKMERQEWSELKV